MHKNRAITVPALAFAMSLNASVLLSTIKLLLANALFFGKIARVDMQIATDYQSI